MVVTTFDRKANRTTINAEKAIKRLFAEYSAIAAQYAADYAKTYSGQYSFRIDDFPELKKRVDALLQEMNKQSIELVHNGIDAQYRISEDKDRALIKALFGKSKHRFPKGFIDKLLKNTEKAQEQFKKRRTNGFTLSERIWNTQKQFRREMEVAMEIGLKDGKSAQKISQDIRKYLNNPDALYRRVRNSNGNLVLSTRAKNYNPGQGVYRSAYKNAMRVARTETNRAYRSADQDRWANASYVVGVRIQTSNNSNKICPRCMELAGDYPKEFKWAGWHPNCYDEESEVLTQRGWKYFKEVLTSDKIFSLNPDNLHPEWVDIALNFKSHYKGDMVRFFNKNLDCMVTPEHEMVHLSKITGDFSLRRTRAIDYSKNKGGFYRSSQYSASDTNIVEVGDGLILNFDLFCEFMGYWLSDGSLIRNCQIVIAQKEGDPNRENIIRCIEDMGLSACPSKDKISLYNRGLNRYLKQFGLSSHKFIPDEIKNASPRQIKVFLDAFISCDGYIRVPRSFVNNRGEMFEPKNPERLYFTTSEHIAGDIGEMLVKIGKRPSYYIDKVAGKEHKFSNGVYTINHDSIRISECNSETATVFKKEFVPYDGFVYDLTLSKNHIMYIRRNGKCFWGSNCRCHRLSILKTQSEMDQEIEDILAGKQPSTESVNTVKQMPKNFKDWYATNKDKIAEMKSKPDFVVENETWVK